MATARTLQVADQGSPLEVLPPVLFNTYKHHAAALRVRIRDTARAGDAALVELAGRMAVLGTTLMDLYTGALWPRDISAKVLGMLGAEGRLELAAFREWVGRQGDYAVVTFPEDGSRWVLRVGDEAERYVHLHPGRWSPATVRVRANVLKTAFLVLAHTALHGGGPLDRALINEVRREYLGLAPLGKDPEGEAGLGAVIELLREPTVAPRQGERGALARVYRVIPTVVHLPNGKAKPDNPLRRHFSGDPPRKRMT